MVKTPMMPIVINAMSEADAAGRDLARRLAVLDDPPDDALGLPVEHREVELRHPLERAEEDRVRDAGDWHVLLEEVVEVGAERGQPLARGARPGHRRVHLPFERPRRLVEHRRQQPLPCCRSGSRGRAW